jgi:hypothetical protein
VNDGQMSGIRSLRLHKTSSWVSHLLKLSDIGWRNPWQTRGRALEMLHILDLLVLVTGRVWPWGKKRFISSRFYPFLLEIMSSLNLVYGLSVVHQLIDVAPQIWEMIVLT